MPDNTADDITIREAMPADAARLVEIVSAVDEETEFLGVPGEWRERSAGFSDRLTMMRETGTGVYLLAEDDGVCIGFLGAFVERAERLRGSVYIAHIGVRRAWRGRGVGTRLFIAVEDWTRARNGWRLDLRVDEENARGLALYRRRGFAPEGRIPHAVMLDGRWHTHFLMAKRLRDFTEPDWEPIDLAPDRSSPVGAVSFRRLLPEEAPLLCRWERQLCAEAPLRFKQPHEVLSEAAAAKILAEQTGSFALAALEKTGSGETVIGYATAAKEIAQRMRHDAFVSVDLLRRAWGCGIATVLMQRVEAWARENHVSRLSASVLGHNLRGQRFAAAQGFAVEVRMQRTGIIAGKSADTLRLGKLGEAGRQ